MFSTAASAAVDGLGRGAIQPTQRVVKLATQRLGGVCLVGEGEVVEQLGDAVGLHHRVQVVAEGKAGVADQGELDFAVESA